jgi:hypothetical protein
MALDPRLERLTQIVGGWPEVERTLSGDHATFRARAKVFAYFLNNHHGDGIVSVCFKTEMGAHIDMAAREPEIYYLPAYIGPRGWAGLRLDRGRIEWRLVTAHVGLSYRLVAPKTLVRALDAALAAPLGDPPASGGSTRKARGRAARD